MHAIVYMDMSLMESDINSDVRSPDDIPEKGCVHSLAVSTVCHKFRSIALVYITVGVHNCVMFTLDHTLLVLALRGEERKKK